MDKETTILSNRELEILHYLKRGFSSKEIAEDLSVSSHTIDTHRRNMLKKTNARNSAELILYGVRAGII